MIYRNKLFSFKNIKKLLLQPENAHTVVSKAHTAEQKALIMLCDPLQSREQFKKIYNEYCKTKNVQGDLSIESVSKEMPNNPSASSTTTTTTSTTSSNPSSLSSSSSSSSSSSQPVKPNEQEQTSLNKATASQYEQMISNPLFSQLFISNVAPRSIAIGAYKVFENMLLNRVISTKYFENLPGDLIINKRWVSFY